MPDMTAGLVVWTVGHSNHDFDVFAGLLAREQIEFLVDVRSHPYSRFAPQFNRDALQHAIGQAGIRYLYLGEDSAAGPRATITTTRMDMLCTGRCRRTRASGLRSGESSTARVSTDLRWFAVRVNRATAIAGCSWGGS